MMKVCYIYQDQYPWDVRVEKIMHSMAESGIEGHIISGNRDGLRRTETLRAKLHVHRMLHVNCKNLNDLINLPAFFSPFWIKHIIAVINRTKPDLVIVRDLPLAPAGLLAAKACGTPILMDMAENYPEMLRDTRSYSHTSLIDHVIRNPDIFKILEKWVIPRMDGVLVVSKASAARIAGLGVNPDSIWVVNNTPKLENLSTNQAPDREILGLGRFIVLYVGGLEETRGLEIAVRAFSKVVRKIPESVFVIVGKGTSEKLLKKVASESGIEKEVVLTGWVEPSRVPSVIAAADVCLVPHFVTEHTNTTIPNKVFDYMAQKKPVIVTHSKTLAEIVGSSSCGLVYRDHDIDALAASIISLNDVGIRERFGSAGYQAIIEKYNWNIDKKVLLRAAVHVSGADHISARTRLGYEN
jgi:glycosyltransferase involved in cell wall biosynthesis